MASLTLTYIYDPLCGWCYGFSPVIKKFYKKFRSKLNFEVISGGMITGEQVGPIGQVAGYISEAYKTVEEKTGVKFGPRFLEALQNGNMIFSSIPPSRALAAFKSFRPNDAILMAHEIQRAIYFDGRAPGDVSMYSELAAKFELPQKQFVEKLLSPSIVDETEKEFEKSSNLGVKGFPTVCLGNENEIMPIANGYLPYEDLLMHAISGASHYDVELL